MQDTVVNRTPRVSTACAPKGLAAMQTRPYVGYKPAEFPNSSSARHRYTTFTAFPCRALAPHFALAGKVGIACHILDQYLH